MSQVSLIDHTKANKYHRAILSALVDHGQNHVAQSLGWQDDKVSRVKGGDRSLAIHEFCQLINACGLKIVPQAYQCFDPVKAQAMMTLYKAAMERLEDPVMLLWGEGE